MQGRELCGGQQSARGARPRLLNQRSNRWLHWKPLRHYEADGVEDFRLDDRNGPQCVGEFGRFERGIGNDAGPAADADVSHQPAERVCFHDGGRFDADATEDVVHYAPALHVTREQA